MYVYKRQVTMQRGIATLLATALVLWAVGAHMFTVVEAADLSYVKDTLSDSNPSSVSDHTIEFLSPNGVAATETIDVTFPNTFTGTGSILFSDVDFEINGTDETLVAGAPGAAQWGFTWSGDVMTLTAGASESLAALATATIKIGTNADGPGVNQLTNPAVVQSYEISISAGSSDSGNTRVAIIDNVTVSADVPTSLTFTVSGVAASTGINGTTTTDLSTDTTLPFGTLVADEIKTLAQDLTVATNARNGYIVTVEQDGPLESTVGADIDSFFDGTDLNDPAVWQAPNNDIADENDWGHWGLTSTDGDLHGAASLEFLANEWIGITTSPRVIMAHDGPADGTTGTADATGDDAGATSIGYQIEITALQEAGDDYSTVLTYIATPTF